MSATREDAYLPTHPLGDSLHRREQTESLGDSIPRRQPLPSLGDSLPKQQGQSSTQGTEIYLQPPPDSAISMSAANLKAMAAAAAAAAAASAAAAAPAAADNAAAPPSPSKHIKSHSMLKHNLNLLGPCGTWKTKLVVIIATIAIGIALGVGLGIGLVALKSSLQRQPFQVNLQANVTVPFAVSSTWVVQNGSTCNSYLGSSQAMSSYVAAVTGTYQAAFKELSPRLTVKDVKCDGSSFLTSPDATSRAMPVAADPSSSAGTISSRSLKQAAAGSSLGVATIMEMLVQQSANKTLNRTAEPNDQEFDQQLQQMKEDLVRQLQEVAGNVSAQLSDASDVAMFRAVKKTFAGRVLGSEHNTDVLPAAVILSTRINNMAVDDSGANSNRSSAAAGVLKLEMSPSGKLVEVPAAAPAPAPAKPAPTHSVAAIPPASSVDGTSPALAPVPDAAPAQNAAPAPDAAAAPPPEALLPLDAAPTAAAAAQRPQDFKTLVSGYSTIPTGQNLASQQYLLGDAFAVALGSDGGAVLSATRYGQGKVVVAGHEGLLMQCCNYADMGGFVYNAIAWGAAGVTMPRIAYNSRANGAAIVRGLEAAGFNFTDVGVVSPSGIINTVADVYIANGQDQGVGTAASTIRAFVQAGGALIVGAQSWYWSYSSPVEAHPSNLLLRPMGIFLSSSTSQVNFSVPADLPPQMAHLGVALDCINATLLGNNASSSACGTGIKYNLGNVIGRLGDGAGFFFDNNPLLAKLQQAATQANNSKAGIDPSNPIQRDSLEGLGALARTILYQVLPPNQLPAAPDAKFFPGLPPAGTQPLGPTTVQVNGSTLASYWQCLGLYALPGQAVTVSLPAALVAVRPTLHIGGWSDTLFHKDQWVRLPKIQRRFTATSGDTVIGSALGGLIYITVPANKRLGALSVSVTGAIRAAQYIAGVTSDADWPAILANSPAPWGEIGSSKLAIASPKYSLQLVKQASNTTNYWDKVQDSNNWLLGLSPERQYPMRIQHDVDISAGYMHSGYPIMTYMDVVNTTVDVSVVDSRWGHFHELGHNHQSSNWTWGCTTEVTVNFFTAQAEMVVNNNKDPANFYGWRGTDYSSRYADMADYMKAPLYSTLCSDAGLFLDSFLMVAEDTGRGMQLLRDTIVSYNNLTAAQLPSTDDDKLQLWVKQQSKSAGLNFVPYYKGWGWPVSAGTEAELQGLNLPVWNSTRTNGYIVPNR